MQYVLAIALGLAVLAKGPVGALLPLAAMGIFVLLEGRLREAFHRISLLAIVFAILLGSELVHHLLGRAGIWISQSPARHRKRRAIFRRARHDVAAVLHHAAAAELRAAEFAGADRGGDGAALAPSRARGNSQLPQPPRRARRCGCLRSSGSSRWCSSRSPHTNAAPICLPLWPPSAVMLAWMVTVASERIGGRGLKGAYAAMCVVLIVVNLSSSRAERRASVVAIRFVPPRTKSRKWSPSGEPLYLYGFGEEVAPLLFYLDRDAPEWSGKLGDAPPGYIIVPAGVWAKKRGEALDLEPVLESNHGNRHLILLHRGKVVRTHATRAKISARRPRAGRRAQGCASSRGSEAKNPAR